MSHPKKYKILIVSPGIEDGGIRGLGRVTLALIDGLAAASQETYLLTSAPLQRPTRKPGSRIHNATIRRALDHYLAEGIRSPMFKLRRWLLLQIFMRDFFRLFGLGHVDALGHKHQIPTQHQPDVLRQYERLSGFFNFGFFYKFSQILPRRLTSAIVFSIARRQGIDAIITASPYPLSKPLIFGRNIKVLQYLHDVMPLNIMETPPDLADRFARELTKAVNSADLIMTSSLNAKDKLQALLPQVDPRVVYLPCFRPNVPTKSNNIDILAKTKLRKGRYILAISTIEKRKNLARLIEAFKLIADRTDFSLVIVGGAGYGFKDAQDSLDGLSPKLRERVILAGYVSEEDKWSLLANCGLVCHPAIDEGLGIPVIEALLAEKPVVCTRLSSIEEFAPRGCTVYIEDPYNIYDIADKLLTGIKSRLAMRPALRKGSAIVAQIFSESAFSQRMQSVLKAVFTSKS